MLEIFSKAFKNFKGSFDQTALIEGISDIIVVKWKSGEFKSTPFLVSFGPSATTTNNHNISIRVNNSQIYGVKFTLDQYGYLYPKHPSQKLFSKLNLKDGKNIIQFTLADSHTMKCELHLYNQDDKILVSDVDGTLTKSDISGLVNNVYGKDHLHDGYAELIQNIEKSGCKIVWLTMRSFALYNFSKNYIQTHTKTSGVLLTVPEQFVQAVKKQITKNTGLTKTNMMKTIQSIFPANVNPFVGGLGNRENDAIAYRAANIGLQRIFIIDTQSKVHRLTANNALTYRLISENLQEYLSHEHMKLNQKFIQVENFKNRQRVGLGLKKKQSTCSTNCSQQN